MINGKFFTGLPPKMIDRGGAVKNRLESHFFWPDDTTSDSAVDTRLKRRTSLQYDQQAKPRLQRHASVTEQDVDTRGRFHKEFAKSSIQFFDNIQEQPAQERQQQGRIRPILKSKSAREEITSKPTATKLELPEHVIDQGYTNAKKKQVFSSKIEFYDFADDELNNAYRNNTRLPRMATNMNDKKEVERNTKNSPKLQIKRNVKNLRDDEAATEIILRNDFSRDSRPTERNTRKTQLDAAPQRDDAYTRGENIMERHEVRNNDYMKEAYEPIPERSEGKYSSNRTERNSANHIAETYYMDEDTPDLSYIENNMRNVRIKSGAKKHVTYEDNYVDEMPESQIPKYHNENHCTRDGPTTSRGGSPYQKPGSNQRQPHRRPTTPDYDDEEYQYMENRRRPAITTTATAVSLNNHNKSLYKPNNNSNSNNNSYKNNNQQQQQRKALPKMLTTTSPPTVSPSSAASSAWEPEETAADAQKHLRSNIFFNETATPTSNFRRNVRSSAVQRVSVGLPD